MNVTASQVRDAFNAAKSLKAACDAEVAAGRYTLVGCSFVGSVGDGRSEQVPADRALARQFNDACQRLTELLDALVANVTGFGGTFCDLLDAQRKNGYRPTFREKGRPEVAVLADCYDYFAGLWGLAEKSYRPERAGTNTISWRRSPPGCGDVLYQSLSGNFEWAGSGVFQVARGRTIGKPYSLWFVDSRTDNRQFVGSFQTVSGAKQAAKKFGTWRN